MRFAFSADDGGAKFKYIYEVLSDLFYYELKIFESFANYAPGGTGGRIFCYSFLASFLPTISRQAHRNRLSAQ